MYTYEFAVVKIEAQTCVSCIRRRAHVSKQLSVKSGTAHQDDKVKIVHELVGGVWTMRKELDRREGGERGGIW